MNAAARLGAYAAGLVVVFTGAFAAAGAVVPEETVSAWTQQADGAPHADGGHEQGPAASADTVQAGSPVRGVTAAQDGYLLSEVTAPDIVGATGELAFTITGPDGTAVTEFETEHEKDLHLIVVRSDGTGYRHVHPVMDETGRWSLPWEWEVAGTYRVYADIVAAGGQKALTLTRTVEVAGDLDPAVSQVSTTDEVDGFDVSVEGELAAGASSALTINVTRDGAPVTDLQPHLGAYGHLVALREDDLAYLHVHPEGAEPVPGEVSGPDVEFVTTAPTSGRYYLYFDFQVEEKVHSAGFVLDSTGSADIAVSEHGGH